MIRLLAISIVIVIIFSPGCIRKRPPPISIETYEFHCRNLTDNALIAEYYRVDMQLQEALDELRGFRRELSAQKQKGGIESGSYALGTALGILISGHNPVKIVRKLRVKRTIILTIMHQRGLTLPVPAK